MEDTYIDDDIWRNPTTEEMEYLMHCSEDAFEVVEGINTKSFWIVAYGCELLTGWFSSEEEAYKWILDKEYLKEGTKWAVYFEMDI